MDDLQARPCDRELRDVGGACPWMPCPPEVFRVTDDIGAVARAHQLLSGLSLAFSDEQRQTAHAELIAGAAGTRFVGAHDPQCHDLTGVK